MPNTYVTKLVTHRPAALQLVDTPQPGLGAIVCELGIYPTWRWLYGIGSNVIPTSFLPAPQPLPLPLRLPLHLPPPLPPTPRAHPLDWDPGPSVSPPGHPGGLVPFPRCASCPLACASFSRRGYWPVLVFLASGIWPVLVFLSVFPFSVLIMASTGFLIFCGFSEYWFSYR